LKSISDFQIVIAIAIPIKTFPEKSLIDFHFEFDQRFPDQNRSAIFRSKSDPDF